MPRAARLSMAGLIVATVLVAPAAPRADELEYAVKAEFIERFTRFIDWPGDSLDGGAGAFVFCIVGDTPIAPHLERMARERKIKDRHVELRRLKATGDVSACHLVFIGPSERARLRQIL